MGHYSERVRKDALTGLSKLLSQHPEVLNSQARLSQPCHTLCHPMSRFRRPVMLQTPDT